MEGGRKTRAGAGHAARRGVRGKAHCVTRAEVLHRAGGGPALKRPGKNDMKRAEGWCGWGASGEAYWKVVMMMMTMNNLCKWDFAKPNGRAAGHSEQGVGCGITPGGR